MRSVCGFLVSFLILAFGFPAPTNAQTASNGGNVPESLLRSLTLSKNFPEFGKSLSSNQLSDKESQNAATSESNLQKRAQDFLQRGLDRNLMTGSSECGHILIYVPPITDTKMIIKVPESAKAPDSTPNSRANPPVRVCGQDLRRVDAPRPVPPLNPNREGMLIPTQQTPVPH